MKTTTYEFSIKKETLGSGITNHIPVVRTTNSFPFVQNKWERITKVYDTFVVLDLHFEPQLTLEEALEHIAGYKEILKNQAEIEIKKTEYLNFEKVLIK